MGNLTDFPQLTRGEPDPDLPEGWIVARVGPPYIWKREIKGVSLLVVQTEEDLFEPQLAFCNVVLEPLSNRVDAALFAQETASDRIFDVLRTLNGQHDLEASP